MLWAEPAARIRLATHDRLKAFVHDRLLPAGN